MTDLHSLELAAVHVRAELLPSLGGALACFELAGQPILRPLARGETHVRQSACFPLVPFSNRVSQEGFRFAGKTVVLPQNADYCPLPLHGVGWQSTWQVVAVSRSEATIVLDYRPQPPNPPWPYAFRAEQTARLFAQGLELELTFENREDHPQPVGLGWHPYFPRSPRMRLAAAVSGMWEADVERLPTRRVPLAHPLPAGVDVAGLDYDHCFFGFGGSARIEWPERGIAVTLRSDPALTHLVIFTPPDRPFIAVEPVSHMIDAFRRAPLDTLRQTGFDPETGVRVVAPRARFSVRMQLVCSELSQTRNRTGALP